jgi:shikimate kinase
MTNLQLGRGEIEFMSKRKIALIGHSGAGKSECLKELGINRDVADMDKIFHTTESPSMEDAMKWMIDDTNEQDVLAVSVHRCMLKKMQQAKENGDRDFCKLFFVYLRYSKEKLKDNLCKPTADNCLRDESNIISTLSSYDDFEKIFEKLADHTICNKELPQVVEEITALRSKLRA